MADESTERIGSGARHDESEKERLDRELIELLNELRVALPGVQVLFAFLLTVPFTQRFTKLNTFQRDVFYATLLCSAAASALLIAPSAQHRLLFRQRAKDRLVFSANKVTIAGLGFLALAIVGAVLVITDFLFGRTATIGFTAGIAALFVMFWYAIPLVRRVADGDQEE